VHFEANALQPTECAMAAARPRVACRSICETQAQSMMMMTRKSRKLWATRNSASSTVSELFEPFFSKKQLF
jgi:hypothetical protein